MNDGFRFLFKATVDELLPSGFTRHGVYRGSHKGVHELVGDADELVVSGAPATDVDGPLLAVVISPARSVNQPYLHAFVADALNVVYQRRALQRCFNQPSSKLT